MMGKGLLWDQYDDRCTGLVEVLRLLPAVQRVAMKRDGVRQRWFGMQRGMLVTSVRLIGRLWENSVSGPPALKSLPAAVLTFNLGLQLSARPCCDFCTGLVVVGGAKSVPQIPVPETCQSQSRWWIRETMIIIMKMDEDRDVSASWTESGNEQLVILLRIKFSVWKIVDLWALWDMVEIFVSYVNERIWKSTP